MVAFSFGAIGKAFSGVFKSAGFKSVATAVGTAFAGELAGKLGGIAAAKGYQASEQPTTAQQAKQAGYLPGGYGYQTTPWGLIVGVIVFVGVVAFVIAKKS